MADAERVSTAAPLAAMELLRGMSDHPAAIPGDQLLDGIQQAEPWPRGAHPGVRDPPVWVPAGVQRRRRRHDRGLGDPSTAAAAAGSRAGDSSDG
jgi:hypothetical protein